MRCLLSKRDKINMDIIYSIINSDILGSIYWKDRNGVYLGANTCSIKMVGLRTVDDIVGKTDYDLFIKAEADQYRKNDLLVMEKGESIVTEENSTLPEGKRLTQLSCKQPLKNERDEIIGIVGNTVNITYLKENEIKLIEKNKNLKAENDRKNVLLEQAEFIFINLINNYILKTEDKEIIENLITDIKKEKFFSKNSGNEINLNTTPIPTSSKEIILGIAHELNQPLSAITNYINGSKRYLKPFKEYPEYTNIIHAMDAAKLQAERASRIIHHLISLFCNKELEREAISVDDLIEAAIKNTALNGQKNNICVKQKSNKILPDLCVNETNIVQVFVNIINNAIENLQKQPNTKDKLIILSTSQNTSDTITVTITDNGSGIEPEFMKRIFSPFTTTKNNGIGIGLSLCYNIINQHNGNITVGSKKNMGTTFNITLPVYIN